MYALNIMLRYFFVLAINEVSFLNCKKEVNAFFTLSYILGKRLPNRYEKVDLNRKMVLSSGTAPLKSVFLPQLPNTSYAMNRNAFLRFLLSVIALVYSNIRI